jgi:hypothetical protein
MLVLPKKTLENSSRTRRRRFVPSLYYFVFTARTFALQYKEKGDESGLHIIIFDELDAIFKQRGSTSGGTGVGDSVVNQLLSKVCSLTSP